MCVYSSFDSLDFIVDSVNKTFLAASDDRLQYEGLPVVIVKAYDSELSEKQHLMLRQEGQLLANRCV